MSEQQTGFRKTGATKQLGVIVPEEPTPAPEPATEPKPDDAKKREAGK
jgi:hypothetical protein